MIFDFHVHLFSDEICTSRESYLSDQNFKLLYNDPASKVNNISGIINYLDENKISKAAVMGFAWKNSDYCIKQNDYFSKAALEFPGRIFPFGTLPAGTRNVHEFCRSIKDAGLYGIGELAFYSSRASSADLDFLSSVLDSSTQLSLPVCLHINEPVGHDYPGKYQTSFNELFKIIAEFPDAVIILSHWGGGMLFYELMPDVKEKLKNCYYDTAASPYLYDEKIYRAAADIVTAEKILFGSDYPLLGVKRYLSAIEKNLNSAEMESVLWGNAIRILGLKK